LRLKKLKHPSIFLAIFLDPNEEIWAFFNLNFWLLKIKNKFIFTFYMLIYFFGFFFFQRWDFIFLHFYRIYGWTQKVAKLAQAQLGRHVGSVFLSSFVCHHAWGPFPTSTTSTMSAH
jgi:hypothetical protein